MPVSRGKGVWFKKQTVEEAVKIDMKDLTKECSQEWDDSLIYSMTNCYGHRSSIMIVIYPPCKIRLQYKYTCNSGEVKSFDYFVDLETTPCNYGGKRWWFLCPSCNRRCRVLYNTISTNIFACRLCHNLTYESQQKGKTYWHLLYKVMAEGSKLQNEVARTRTSKKKIRLLRQLDKLGSDLNSAIKHRQKGGR